ncbi:MAG: hypothetical protein ACT4QG_17340 [Sporichthyaceae bacterium]
MADSAIVDEGAIAKLVEHCRATLGPSDGWAAVAGYPDSVALAVLDSFWSPDGTSDRETAEQVLAVYREMREAEWGDAETDGANELIVQFDVVGGPAYFAEQLKKAAPEASSRKAILSAAGSLEACELLRSADLGSAAELRGAKPDALRGVERPWKRIAGQRSGESFNRVLLLTGCPVVNPDRPLLAFASAALGTVVEPADAAAAYAAAAEELGTPVQVLATLIRRSVGHVDEA